jgi:hypothetical protein
MNHVPFRTPSFTQVYQPINMENLDRPLLLSDIWLGPQHRSNTLGQAVRTTKTTGVNDPITSSLYANPATGTLTADNLVAIKAVSGTTGAFDRTVSAESFTAKSDKRLKENLVEYHTPKSILDLPVYKYNFISDEAKTEHIGCMAQDLQEVCPEIVSTTNDGYLAIEENKIVYLLLEEVKKLKAEVEELKAKN